MTATSHHALRDGLRAGAPAAVLSALPSSVYALLTRRDPLEASIAAGSIAMPREHRRHRLLIAAVPVHLALSSGWAVALAAVLPCEKPATEGTLAGLMIAGLDLGLIGRHYPRIRALPLLPQVADHVAFGIITALVLARHRRDRDA